MAPVFPTFLAAALLVCAAPARAQCADPDRPVVTVRFLGDSFGAPFRAGVVEHLGVAVRVHGFSVCAPEDLTPGRIPEARIELTAPELPRVGVTVEVHDAVTQKRVARQVNLGDFPEDSRAFALAVTTDELLRASWMELALEDAPSLPPPPTGVRRAVDRAVERAGGQAPSIGLRLAFEAYSAGERHAGGDLVATLWPVDWLALDLSVGARRGFRRAAEGGSVRSHALLGGADLRWRVLGAGALALDLGAGARVAQVVFEGDPSPGVEGRTATDIAVLTRVGVLGTVTFAPRMDARLGGGAVVPVRGVGALDGDQRVTAVDGIGLYAELGASLRF